MSGAAMLVDPMSAPYVHPQPAHVPRGLTGPDEAYMP
jgi:hypothetical protein